jgi:hypothetical protein
MHTIKTVALGLAAVSPVFGKIPRCLNDDHTSPPLLPSELKIRARQETFPPPPPINLTITVMSWTKSRDDGWLSVRFFYFFTLEFAYICLS